MVGVTQEDITAFKGSFGKDYERVGDPKGGSIKKDKNALLRCVETVILAGSAPQKVIDMTKLPSKRLFETRKGWTLTINYVSGPF